MRKTSRSLTLLLCGVCLLGMGGTMTPEQCKTRLKTIDLSDGISKEEAIIIAQNYSIDEGSEKFYILSRPSVKDSSFTVDGAGRPLAPCWEVRFPTMWRVRLKQGLLWGTVLIDKQTGHVKGSGAGPDS